MSFDRPPDFPILANVWIETTSIPPFAPIDYATLASVSPLPAGTWITATSGVRIYATDIIRMPKDRLLTDNFSQRRGSSIFPASLIEAPADSMNYYWVLWTHIVGRGFPNEFRRAYCFRVAPNFYGPSPP